MLDWLLAIYKFVFPFLVGGWVRVGSCCAAVVDGRALVLARTAAHTLLLPAFLMPLPACSFACLPACLPCLQIISMVAKMSGGQEEGEAAKPAQADRAAAAEEHSLPPALERQLSRRASQQQQQHVALYSATNGLGEPFAQQQLQRRQPLAINGSVARPAKAGGSSSSGAADRGGSLSPRGPETPMEGSAGRLLPQHPTAAAGGQARLC
jgi:hypothetical protein